MWVVRFQSIVSVGHQTKNRVLRITSELVTQFMISVQLIKLGLEVGLRHVSVECAREFVLSFGAKDFQARIHVAQHPVGIFARVTIYGNFAISGGHLVRNVL